MTQTPPHRPWLSSGQHRLTAFAVTSLAIVALIGVFYLVVQLLGEIFAAFGEVIWPLALAGLLAMLLRPVVNRIERHLKLSRVQAIMLLYVLVVAVCVTIGVVFVPLAASQLIDFVHYSLPDIIKGAYHRLKDALSQYPDIYQSAKNYLDEKKLQTAAQAETQNFLKLLLSTPATLRKILELTACVAVIPIYLFFLLETDHDLVREMRTQLTFLPTQVREDAVFLVEEFVGIMFSFFQGQLLIGLIMGILKAIGFTLIGIKGGFILGLLFGFLNIVPYLGTILGLTFVLPIAYFQGDGGNWPLVLEAIGVFVFVQVCEGYFLTPKIMGKRTGLHPMVIIVSIFFWGSALHGLAGMIFGVPLTAFLVVFWRLLKNKYLPKHGVTTPSLPVKKHAT